MAEDVTKIAGIVTGVAFFVGLLYDLGYFMGLDLQLFPLLSYKDHLETLAFFVPIAVVPILLCLTLRSKLPRRRRIDPLIGGLAAATLIAWLERDEIAGLPRISAFMVWFVAVAAFLLAVYCTAIVLQGLLDLTDDKKPDTDATGLVYGALGTLVFVTLLGNVRGHLDAAGTSFDTRITFAESDAKPQIRPARLVRAIDGGLLLVFQDSPDQVAYVRYEAIHAIAEKLRP